MIAIPECGFRDLWPLPCWKYRDSLNVTTNVAFSRPVWICMLWISWWKCPVNWNTSLFLAQLHQIQGETFPHFDSLFLSFRSDVSNSKDDFTKFINKNAWWHHKILFFSLTNVGAVNGSDLPRRRETAALISMSIIYWNMKGEETKSVCFRDSSSSQQQGQKARRATGKQHFDDDMMWIHTSCWGWSRRPDVPLAKVLWSQHERAGQETHPLPAEVQASPRGFKLNRDCRINWPQRGSNQSWGLMARRPHVVFRVLVWGGGSCCMWKKVRMEII